MCNLAECPCADWTTCTVVVGLSEPATVGCAPQRTIRTMQDVVLSKFAVVTLHALLCISHIFKESSAFQSCQAKVRDGSFLAPEFFRFSVISMDP
jgi:hypothetical protein